MMKRFGLWMLCWAVLVFSGWVACLAKYLGDLVDLYEEEQRLREERK